MGVDNTFGETNLNNEKLKITIELKNGRWLVNKKQLQDCSEWEKDFMNKFFHEVRIQNLINNA